PTNRAAIAEQREETITLERERQQGDRLRREEKAEEKTQRKIDRELAKEKCVKARERYDTYYNAPRLYRTTEDGDFEYLSSEEIDALHAKEMTAISKWCG
ncbi:MAG: hypothetical protein IH809_05505, partial [Proteobacteria bacterium]|nr:hypothetical protein [Pseudomonadota bacterium]